MEEPWTKVLDLACNWADDKTEEDGENGAIKPITVQSYAYFDSTHNYDGARSYAYTETFHLTNFLEGSLADCNDMSAWVYTCMTALGSKNVKTKGIIGPFWFKKRLNPIGRNLAKYKPGGFWPRMPGDADPNHEWSWGIGQGTYEDWCYWNSHQVVVLNSKVYDPTAKVDISEDKVPTEMTEAAYKTFLFNPDPQGSTWTWGPAINKYASCD